MQRRLAGSWLKRAGAVSLEDGERLTLGRCPRSLFGALLACFLVLLPASAHSESARVVVLDGPDSDELGRELSARVRGELRAAGFEVLVLTLPSGVPPSLATETAARHLTPAAVLAVRRIQDAPAANALAEVWISEGGGPADGRLVPLSGSDESHAIAKFGVQVAELVKARLAELAVTGPAGHSAVPAAPPPDPAQSSLRWTAGAAIGALADVAGGTALFPLVRFGMLLEPNEGPVYWELRSTLGAFGTDVIVSDGALRAAVQQAFGSADFVVRFRTSVPVEPAVLIGAGAFSANVRGVAPAGYEARAQRVWAALGTIGGGLMFEPVDWLRWTLEAQALAITPGTVVRLADREQAARAEWQFLFSSGITGVF